MLELNSNHFTLQKVSQHAYAAIAKEGSGSVANAGIIDLGEETLYSIPLTLNRHQWI